MADVPNPPTETPSAQPRGPIRWWPAVVVVLLAAVASTWVRSSYGRHRQDQNIAIANIIVIAFLLLLLWSVLFSRFRGAIRVTILGLVLTTIILVPALFRIHGVTGDLVPILEWRWHRRSWGLIENRNPGDRRTTTATETTNDYPQFLGPNRNGTVAHTKLAHDWKAQPPQLLWRRNVGPGWSGFAIAGNQAITQEQRGENEAVVCYDLISGAEVWAHSYATHFQSSLAGEGPRATPSVVGKRVFALGATAILNCLELQTGKRIWSKDIAHDNACQVNEWGMSGSPLILDEMVIVSAGGAHERSLVAYKAATGEFVWGAGTDGAGYSSPVLSTLAGVSQILIFNSGGVTAHATTNGKVLWKYPWPGGHPHVSTPIVLPEDRVLISSGYGIGSELIKIRNVEGKFTATRLWKSNRLKAKFTNLVYRDGYIYGLDDGIMVCLDAANGELKWKEGRYGHGQEILTEDALLVMAETGEVVLLEPNSRQLRELTRFPALKNKTWNPPALAGEFLVVRNDKEAACYRLQLIPNNLQSPTSAALHQESR